MVTTQLSKLRAFVITIFLFLFILIFSTCKQTDGNSLSKKDTIVTDTASKNVGKMLPLIYEPVKHLDTLFTKAMLSAQNPTPEKIYSNLLTIKGNNTLIDTLIQGERYVQMVSWKGDPSYFPKSGAYDTTIYDIWVTAAPIIKDSCRSFFKTQKDPYMRLRQLLGLQPFTIETFFLELWVKPDDLYRPCPDNETTDTACELNMPDTVTDAYRKWFNHTRAVQYNDCTDTEFHEFGYPWTQLGYTYDWSPENHSHIGLSEFVIRKNTIVYVKGKHTTKMYCTG